MPKNNKVYEYDYEWSGQENEVKGLNINKKNPWSKPEWGGIATPNKDHSGPQSSYVSQSERFGTMEELQRKHQWEKPDWATMQKNTGVDHNTNSASGGTGIDDQKNIIIKDPIPKPMLKKTVAGVASGILGASTTKTPSNGTKGKNQQIVDETEREIIEMERRIEEARQKKVALEQQQQQKLLAEVEEEASRQKHTVEESKLERARRLAKEREDARWRATLAERNVREKERREQARLAALNKTTPSKPSSSSDAVWERTQSEQQQQYEERVRQEAKKRQEIIEQEMTIAKEQQQHVQRVQLSENIHPTITATNVQVATYDDIQNGKKELDDDDDNEEAVEEEIIEEYIEEYIEEEEDDDDMNNAQGNNTSRNSNSSGSHVDEIQQQIDALRKELEMV